jgi:hypothetical protein
MSETTPATSGEPRKLFLRRCEVQAWMGISRYELSQLIKCGVIKGRRMHPGGWLFFPREHVRAVIIRLQAEEE